MTFSTGYHVLVARLVALLFRRRPRHPGAQARDDAAPHVPSHCHGCLPLETMGHD